MDRFLIISFACTWGTLLLFGILATSTYQPRRFGPQGTPEPRHHPGKHRATSTLYLILEEMIA